MKISIIMPTYNDADTILESIESVVNQTYENWELIIVDDGSTDDTKGIIEDFVFRNNISEKITYCYKENSDQLNAVAMGVKYVSGQYVYILHSDDMLLKSSLQNFYEYELRHKGFDAYVGNISIIDEEGNEISTSETLTYKKSNSRLALMSLWLGRNLYKDCAFWNVSVFKSNVYNSYLKWNMPFWLKTDFNKVSTLNVKNMPVIVFKYRIHAGNYINDDIGKLNVLNGELRVLSILIKNFNLPAFKSQYFLFRVCNKLGLLKYFHPIFFPSPQRNPAKIIEFAIQKRIGKEYNKNIFLDALVQFYKNYTNREITLAKLPEDLIVYYGADMRAFNKALINGTISNFYLDLFKEMQNGFSIVWCDKRDIDNLSDILKFLCIYPSVSIRPL